MWRLDGKECFIIKDITFMENCKFAFNVVDYIITYARLSLPIKPEIKKLHLFNFSMKCVK